MQAPARRPGRPERPVDPDSGPQDAFAFALRRLREDNGSPSYRAMARRVPYAASTLARAASGDSLPHRDLALAYVRACGGDQDEWQSHWDAAAAAATPSERDRALLPGGGLAPGQPPPHQNEPSQPAVPSGPEKPRRRPRGPGRLIRLALLILATAAVIAFTVEGPASHGTRPQLRPPATSSLTSSPASRPSRAQPLPSAQPPQTSSGGGSRVRFDFEQPDQAWSVFWGQPVATGGITSTVAYRGTHSYEVTVTGATDSKGYSAVGTTDGLDSLRPGMHVTVHIWFSRPADTAISFFAMNPSSQVSWVPQDPAQNIPLPSGAGWSAMTWTVPAVSQVHAIGIQVHSSTNAPLTVAIDDVSW